jgi:hypothetical protein
MALGVGLEYFIPGTEAFINSFYGSADFGIIVWRIPGRATKTGYPEEIR